jgi:hypothetical protein
VFLVILSPNSTSQRGIKDDLSLAYITSKPVVPVFFGEVTAIMASLPPEIKLMVEPLPNWQFDPKVKENQLDSLMAAINVRIDQSQTTSAVVSVSSVSSLAIPCICADVWHVDNLFQHDSVLLAANMIVACNLPRLRSLTSVKLVTDLLETFGRGTSIVKPP